MIATAVARCLPRLAAESAAGGVDRMLRYHGLSAIAADTGRPHLDRKWLDAIRRDAAAYAAQWMSWQIEWRRVLGAQSDIEVLVLKGAALAHTLYPQPYWRMLGDLDLLIEPRSRSRFDAALRAAGYRPTLSTGGDLLFAEQQYVRQLGPGLESRVDLHWALSNRPALGTWSSWSELWSRSVGIAPLAARGLGARDALLNACVHRIGHHRRDGDRLIWLLDIHLLWIALGAAGRTEAVTAAKHHGVSALLLDGLDAASARFGTETEPALQRRLREAGRREAGARLLTPAPEAWQDLATLHSWRDRFRYLGQLLFPPRSYMNRRYPDRRHWRYLRRWWDGLRKSLRSRP